MSKFHTLQEHLLASWTNLTHSVPRCRVRYRYF